MKIRRIVSLLIVTLMMVQMMPVDIMATSETENQEPVQEEIQEEIQEEPVEKPDTEKQDEKKTSGKESAESEPDKTENDQADPEGGKKDTSGEEKLDAEEDSNKEEDSDAEFIKKKKIEAVDVQGEAAISMKAAKNILLEKTDISADDVADTVDELFNGLRGAADGDDTDKDDDNTDGDDDDDDDQDDEDDDEDVPREMDGSFIEGISAKWITNDTVDNGDPALLYRRPARNADDSIRMQINYALSGEHSYDPGDITITVPAHIFKDRNGRDIGNLIIPYPEDPSRRGDFNWKLIGDKYVITNTKRMSAATKGYIQFQIEGLTPSMIHDMETSAPFDAFIEVVTHKDNVIGLRSNKLTAQLDTEARITDVNKRLSSIQRVKASSIPENQRVPGETEYILVNWYVWGDTKANTYYTISQTDSIPQDLVVESRKVVADGEVKDENKEISYTDAQAIDPDCHIGDKVALKTEADINGFIIGGNSADTTSIVKNNVYRGAGDGRGREYTFSTAYPASQFQKDVEYTFHNAINYTVTEVDPEVSENTNPNVQSVDPKLVTTMDKPYIAKTTWSYSDPKWIEPGGHYMVTKNGNDDKEGSNSTHRNIYKTNDLHLHNRAPYGSTTGWYGIYPSALNRLQDQNRDHGEDGSVRLSYTIDTVGYVLPWMYDGGLAEFHENELPARIIGNYNRPITITTKDTGISIGRNGSKLTIFDDYTFEEIEFPESPYVYTGKPKNIEPDGSWTALDHGDGTFEYKRDSNKANWPDIKLQIQRNGEWEDWAVASWKSGSRKVTLTSGGTVSNGIVKVPADTENFRTIVELKNTVGGEGAEEAIQAAIDYDVRAVINLKSTNDLISQIEEAFTKSNTPSMTVYNGVNMLAERADEPQDGDERTIVSINREGYDSIRGYTTDTSVYPYKRSKQYLREVDYEARTIKIHYEAWVEEKSVINDKRTWQQAIDDGRLLAETSGIWRDLLPRGVTPDLSTIELRNGDRIKDAYTIENYKGTHRTLLVVEADLTPVAETYQLGDMWCYQDVPKIKFDATYDFESMIDFGTDIHNVIAFESGNKTLGTIEKYSGEPDDPTLPNHKNIATERAFNDVDANEKAKEKQAMKDLDPDHDYENFVYAGDWTHIDILNAARTSLYKDVMVNNDGIWSEGTYYKDFYDDPPKEATEGGRMRTVYEGGQYSYRLRIMSDVNTISTDMIMYDSLENFYATGTDPNTADNDIIDVDAPRWHGTFLGVDTSQLEELGCAPVVYYYIPTGDQDPELQLSDENDPDVAYATNVDLTNRDIWTPATEYTGPLAAVKAIAVDCSYASDDADDIHRSPDGKFLLQELESIVVNIRMLAPSGSEAEVLLDDEHRGRWGESAQAYNNAYLLCTNMDKDDPSSMDTDNFVRKDYTKVGLKEYSVKTAKVWNDDKDRDGIRPDEVTFTLYADGEPFLRDGEPFTKTLNVAEGEKEVVFEHIPYTTPEGEKIHYTVKEDDVEGYRAAQSINEEASYTFTNIHEPEKINIPAKKTWSGDEELTNVRPKSIDLILYANGKEDKRVTVIPDAQGNWEYEFTNLFKNENGKPIKYTVEEAKTDGTGDLLDSYVTEIDGFDIKNTYHPFGDLTVTKTIEGTTEVSEEKEFNFTFSFRKVEKQDDGSEEYAPVSDEFDYEILDENGDAVTGDNGEPVTGKISNNGEIKIKGGQTIHVKELPEYITYSVTEDEVPGFTMGENHGMSGTIEPNKTAEATVNNVYEASGQINLGAVKKLENRILNKYQFRFELYKVTQNDQGEEEEVLARTATSDVPTERKLRDDGTVDYSVAPALFGSLPFTQEDHGKTYTYRVKEIDTDKAGYEYSEALYTVDVAVTDNGNGTLSIVPTYKNEDGEVVEYAEFVNTYTAKGSTTLRAWKTLQGRALEEDEFTFELLDEHGDPVMNKASDDSSDEPQVPDDGTDQDDSEVETEPVTVTNAANGTVVFDPANIDALNYTEKDIGKTFYYAIREKNDEKPEMIYDETVFGYKVTISDNGDGTLFADQSLATPELDDNGKITGWTSEIGKLPVFENELKDGNFSVQKTVENPQAADPDQEFHFKVKLIGDRVTDDTITGYKLSKVGDDVTDGSDDATDQNNTQDNDDPGDVQSASANTDMAETVSAEIADSIETVPARNEMPQIRLATAGDIASGTFRGADWRITSDGTLIIGNGGTQTLNGNGNKDNPSAWPWYSYRTRIKAVKFDGTVNMTGSAAGMFKNETSLTTFDSTGFNPSNANNFAHMFYGDSVLTSVDAKGWVTSRVANIDGMFMRCYAIKKVNTSEWDVSSVVTIYQLFENCRALEEVDTSSWKTYKTNAFHWMNDIFSDCHNLKDVDTSGWVIQDTIEGWQWFNNDYKIRRLDLSGVTRPTNRQYESDCFGNMYSLSIFKVGTKTFDNNVARFQTGTWKNLATGQTYDGNWLNRNWKSNMAGTYARLTATFYKNGEMIIDWGYDESRNSEVDEVFIIPNDTGGTPPWNSYSGKSNVTKVIINTDISPQSTASWFSGMSSLKTIEGLEHLKMTNLTNMQNMFNGCRSLESIYLPDNFSFKGKNITNTSNMAILPTPPTGADSDYTGRWMKDDLAVDPMTPAELRDNYVGGMTGNWIWEKKDGFRVKFTAEEASGSMPTAWFVATKDQTLPANAFSRFGYDFDHWVVTDSEGTPLDPALTYDDEGAIPANRYESGDIVYLKAVFKERDTSVEMKDGEFEFTLKADEKATFENIPAGTAYQVYEETPNGWVLVSQTNASGLIEPLETQAAEFVNRYEPGTTSVQFFGTKTLDNKAAKADAFSFILKEGDEELQTVSTQEGGFIQFDPIKYTAPGEHVYTIVEKDPEDDTIEWDTHEETVTVTVTQDDSGNLTAEVVYDDDNIKFTNKTRPGNLRITKRAEGLTDANKNDEFTFKITLNNEDGMPLGEGDEVYWYTEDAKKSGSSKNINDQNNGGKNRSLLEQTGILEAQGGLLSEADTPSKSRGFILTAGGDGTYKRDFDYTGAVQTYKVPFTGDYQFESWGASGQNVSGTHNVNPNDYTGGKGGYAKGTIHLKAGTTIYVYVGGKGNASTHESNTTYGWVAQGGWNGGGISRSDIATDGSGGGATDFRLVGGDWNNFNSLKSRIMIAGGGGGAGKWDGNYGGQGIEGGNGGAGGGLRGADGTSEPFASGTARTTAKGGTQTAGGSQSGRFGQGAEETSGGGSGGGGYFGGGMQQRLHRGGGGGSGFVSGLSGCNAISESMSSATSPQMSGQPNHYSGYTFTDAALIAGTQSFKAPDGTNETGHTGNGFARVTPLKCEITYEPNGATGESVKKTYDVDDITTPHALELGMEYDNHTFIGWAKDPDAETPDYEADELLSGLDEIPDKLYAVWLSEDEYLLHLDGNGGLPDIQRKRIENKTVEFDLSSVEQPNNPGSIFDGWNTKKDGSGESFSDKVTGEQIGAEPGQTVTLYAKWLDENEYAKCKVEHYRQTVDGGYVLYEVEYINAARGDTISPDEKEYPGYLIKEHDEEYTVPAVGEDDLVVQYYYDLFTYKVVYDGNGATSGAMDGEQEMQGNVKCNLWKNEYKKDLSVFTGWGTEPDGPVKYVDQQEVKNIASENGATVTLYAQWLSYEDNKLEPTNGEIIVTCKAGEAIVIPDLPAGTTYTIEEINNPRGWTQKGEITEGSGTIQANVTSDASVLNEYNARGEALISAHKVLTGEEVDYEQFTFELLDKDKNVIQTVKNGLVDTYETIDGDDGEQVTNPYYQTAIVNFESIAYTLADVGEPITYYIREVKDDEVKYEYDEALIEVKVTVTDAGKGVLLAEVEYKDPTTEMFTSGEYIFKNKVNPASLKISKSIETPDDDTMDDEFEFKVDLFDKDGAALEGEFDYEVSEDGEAAGSGTISAGDIIKIKGGQVAEITGIPEGASYKVTEQEKEDWELISSEGTEGEFEAGKTEEASFINEYHKPPEKVYDAEGSIVLKANKAMDGSLIFEEDGFMFELVAEDGTSQTKTCDKVTTDDEKVSFSEVTFDEIKYDLSQLEYPEAVMQAQTDAANFINTLQEQYNAEKKAFDKEHKDDDPIPSFPDFDTWFSEQDGTDGLKPLEYLNAATEKAQAENPREKTFTYYVSEVQGDDPDVTYDSTRYYYKVRVVDNFEGELICTPTMYKLSADGDERVDSITFVNSRTTQIKVYKWWDDANNQDGYRPTAEQFKDMIHLMNGDTEVTGYEPRITEDSDGNFTILYSELPACDDEGNKITYTVKEDPIDEYVAKNNSDEVENDETMMNYHQPEKINVTVHKTWDDQDDFAGKREGVKATVQLYGQPEGGEKKAVSDPVEVSTEDDWSYTWEELPRKEKGKEITYTVEESMEDDTYYKVKVDPINEDYVIEVTNTCTVTDLVLRKSMPVRVSGEGENSTIAFKVEGKNSAGEVIYTSTVGFAFNDESDAMLEKTLKDVPIDAEITVTEVYSGNYDPEDEEITKTKIERVGDSNVWVFEFNNTPDDNYSGSGAVNKYEIKDDEVKFKDSEK